MLSPAVPYAGLQAISMWPLGAFQQVWPGEPPNGPEGKAGLRQDHHETDWRVGLLGPVSGQDGVRLTPSVVYHPVSKNEQSVLPVSENQSRVGWPNPIPSALWPLRAEDVGLELLASILPWVPGFSPDSRDPVQGVNDPKVGERQGWDSPHSPQPCGGKQGLGSDRGLFMRGGGGGSAPLPLNHQTGKPASDCGRGLPCAPELQMFFP